MIKSGKYKDLEVVGGIQVGLTSIEIYGFNYDGIINSELLPNTYNDMVFGDTGFHSLQFADKIFNFSEIYLAGFDYYVCEKTYHHNESVSDEDKMNRFKNWSIGKVLCKYKEVEWSNKIYNLNKKSSIDIFPYKQINI